MSKSPPPADSDVYSLEYQKEIPRTIDQGIQEIGSSSAQREHELRRSISGRAVVKPSVRLPAEFRTLSIHVDDRKFEKQSSNSSNSQGEKAESGYDKFLGKRKVPVGEISALVWHKIPVEEVCQRLAVAPQTGLDTDQVQRRTQAYGKNVISPPPSHLARKIFGYIFGGFGSLLLAASIVCFVAWKPLGEPDPQASNLALAVVLLIVVALQAGFNAWQDFSTSRVMASISGMLPTNVAILRSGVRETVPASALVPGDIVFIEMGMKIPADFRLVQTSGDLRFDRSILTGESESIAGRVDSTNDNFLETKNIALQGTLCVSGSGLGIVIQTGDLTVFGRIAKLSSSGNTGLTTLQREIIRVVAIIAGLALTTAVIIVILWASWLRVHFPSYINVPGLLVDLVSVMVAFIPEGLPIAVTMSLAKIASILSKRKVLCKSLSIVETLGSVDVLCSDKTGTLTQNKMHVEVAAVLDVEMTPAELRDQMFSKTVESGLLPLKENIQQLAAISAICNSGTFMSADRKEIAGDATDCAILAFSEFVHSADKFRAPWQQIYKMSFNSKTKFMLKLSQLDSEYRTGPFPAPIASWDGFKHDDFLLTIKGAPEILLPRCDFVVNPRGGAPIPLTANVREQVVGIQEQWAADGRRVLLLARRIIASDMIPVKADPDSEEFAELIEELNEKLIVVGLVGLIDPLKPDIIETVRICRGAGIRFFVVTGDHPTTSVAIAAQAGIITNRDRVHRLSNLDPNMPIDSMEKYDASKSDDGGEMKSIVITGAELAKITPSQMEQVVHYDEIVFARTTPEQKLKIVREFRQRDHIVAMTGDGVNDAPSLKAANIGIAMGNGSDVAREAADMVLLEDFSAIVTALEYGRLVFDNLKKSVLYLLPAGSFSELMPVLLNILIGVPQMLSNIQMIIICVGTDVLPALSMCLEGPESGLLTRRPRNIKKNHLIDWKLLLHAYFFVGIMESLCAMSMAFWYLQRHGVPFSSLALQFGNWPLLTPDLLDEAQTVYFFTLVIMQWGNLFATRCRRLSIFQHTPAKNYYVFPAAIMALCIGIFFSYIPWFQKIFQSRGIPAEHFFLPMAFGLVLLSLDELRKWCVRTYPNGFLARIAW